MKTTNTPSLFFVMLLLLVVVVGVQSFSILSSTATTATTTKTYAPLSSSFKSTTFSITTRRTDGGKWGLNMNSVPSETTSQSKSASTFMSTTVAPPREKEKVDTGRKTNDDDRSTDPDDIVRYHDAPLEYLEDEWSTREPDDPFHILLLDTTFTRNLKVTVPYIAGCITYVLGMPEEEAKDLTFMAKENGFSCLGTWEREECLRLGRQLQIRDCVVRVVPFCQGGSRGWQAKDASAGGSSSSSSSSGGSGGGGGYSDFSASGGSFF